MAQCSGGSAPHSHSETQDPSISWCHHPLHPSMESLHPSSTERVCVKDCTQGLCHLYPHTTSQKPIPQPHSFQGHGKLEIVIWTPKKKSKGGLGNTQHSLPLHHFIHENSEVQRGAVIIPRSHSWPAPRSTDFPSTKYSLYPW